MYTKWKSHGYLILFHIHSVNKDDVEIIGIDFKAGTLCFSHIWYECNVMSLDSLIALLESSGFRWDGKA